MEGKIIINSNNCMIDILLAHFGSKSTGFKLGSSRALPAGLICESSNETISNSNSTLPYKNSK